MTRVACIQMTSSHHVSENLLTAHELILQAVEQEAKLIVLPEMFAIIGMKPEDKLKYKEEFGKGPIQNFLQNMAAEYKVWLVCGTIPLSVPHRPDKIYASCLVYDDHGKCVGRYDKIHLFDVTVPNTQEIHAESAITEPGTEIVVLKTPFGKLGLAVCYDVRFPEMFRLMQKENVEIIALPSAFTFTTGSAHWDILVRARAIENLAYVLASAQTGIHTNKRKTFGHSMIVNPWGEVQVCLPENSGVIIADINLDFLKTLRKDFPALSHRKKI